MTLTIDSASRRELGKPLFPAEESIPVAFGPQATHGEGADHVAYVRPTVITCNSCQCTTGCGPIGSYRLCGC